MNINMMLLVAVKNEAFTCGMMKGRNTREPSFELDQQDGNYIYIPK